MSFIHLHTHTPFSFLDGASSIEELVDKAVSMDMPAIAVTDHNNVCAAVKFFKAARSSGIQPLQGVEITMENKSHLTLLARNARGYASICSLLTQAHLNNPRNQPLTSIEDLKELEDTLVFSGCRRGNIASLILQGRYRDAYNQAREYLSFFKRENFYIEMQYSKLPGDRFLNYQLLKLAESLDIEPAATNNVHYAHYEDFIIHDVLTCVRTLSHLNEINPYRPLNGENYLKSAPGMQELFSFCPRAVENTFKIAEQCEAVFKDQECHLPSFKGLPAGKEAVNFLYNLAYDGAKKRYGKVDKRVGQRLQHELNIVCRMGFAGYFLVIWDIVKFARSQGIRYAGRGSAADSLLAYCLYITEVDSLERGLLFERFMSTERTGLPDIDIDFEARCRDKVIDYVYKRYGKERVARIATYNTFQARSAVREIGKVLNFPDQELNIISKSLPHTHADDIRGILYHLPELKNSILKEKRFEFLLDVCEKIAGFPRFLGTHLGGLVISDIPLNNLTPLQHSALGPVITQFDKDDIETLGLAKLDLLSLRTLSAVNDASHYIAETKKDFNYEKIPLDDKASYEMINQGETIGVFQLESPAQRALQHQLKANKMEDIVASMALIRPGPIQGNMVKPYVARKNGEEAINYLHPLLKPILEKTYGVILFQEQVMEIASSIAGFTPGEADQLRRVMTHARSKKTMQDIGKLFIAGSIKNGISTEIAREIFSYIMGYASYGFCEAHAAAFAATSFKTAYLSRHYPAQWFTAILNNQPMGYYPANIICTEARQRGVKILPLDINRSRNDFYVDLNNSIRIGLKQVKGIGDKALKTINKARGNKEFISLADFIYRTEINQDIIEKLIKSGAFDIINHNRRQLLLSMPSLLDDKVRACKNEPGILFSETNEEINDFPQAQKRAWEFEILGIDIEEHFMASFRNQLQARRILSSQEIKKLPDRAEVTAAGLLFRPHRPPTRSGKITVFLSLEDEFGLTDVTVFEDTYMKYGNIIFGKHLGPLLVQGKIKKNGAGASIIARRLGFLKDQLSY